MTILESLLMKREKYADSRTRNESLETLIEENWEPRLEPEIQISGEVRKMIPPTPTKSLIAYGENYLSTKEIAYLTNKL